MSYLKRKLLSRALFSCTTRRATPFRSEVTGEYIGARQNDRFPNSANSRRFRAETERKIHTPRTSSKSSIAKLSRREKNFKISQPLSKISALFYDRCGKRALI